MNKKSYILFLPKWYPCRNMPLSGIFIQRHAKAVSSLTDVAVLYAVYDEKLKGKWIEEQEETEDGVWTLRYYYRKTFTGLGFLDKPLKLFLYFLCLHKGYSRIVKQIGRPALIHVHVLLRTGIFAYSKSLFSNIPYIISEHWSGYLKECNAYRGTLRKKLSGFIVRKSSLLTTVSEALKQAMQSRGLQNRTMIIPNVVDTNKFFCQAVQEKKKIRILYIADLIEEVKNISAVLRVVKRLSEQRTGFEFVLIGDGKDKPVYKEYCRKNELLDKIVFMKGYVQPVFIPTYLCESDFLVLFSHFETQGTVLLEAMSCGKPVLAAGTGGMKELVNESNGMLIQPGSEEDLLDKMNFMMDHFQTYKAEAIRKFVTDRFSEKVVAKQFYDVYTSVRNLTEK
ncbi:MAG: glycosyltransferase family 4 protein [Cytophagaceae bacterium]